MIDATADVPVWALDMGLRDLERERVDQWRPTVGEVRRAAAFAVARVRREVEQRPEDNRGEITRRTAALLFALARDVVGQPHPEPNDVATYLTPEVARVVLGRPVENPALGAESACAADTAGV